MVEVEDDRREFAIALEGEGDTPPAYIRVRDDALIEEIRALRSAIELILERLDTVEGI